MDAPLPARKIGKQGQTDASNGHGRGPWGFGFGTTLVDTLRGSCAESASKSRHACGGRAAIRTLPVRRVKWPLTGQSVAGEGSHHSRMQVPPGVRACARDVEALAAKLAHEGFGHLAA